MYFFYFEPPRWKQLEYSKKQVIKAGEVIRNKEADKSQHDEAITIIDNWRAAHAYPLHVFYMNLRRMAGNDGKIIVAERLKRLNSIINKLKREPEMNLWRMQDLGGCRFIVNNLEDVYKYANKYKNSRIRHQYQRTYDYIKQPKLSGYRSLHLVYKFHSDKNETYNRNMLIELQFRTHLQHLWATAVEAMGLFTEESIKSGYGSDDIKRFFALISSLFAIEEGMPVVPNTSESVDELVTEIKKIDKKNKYLGMLSAIRIAADNLKIQNQTNKKGYYILILNYNTRRLKLVHYKSNQIEEANAQYNMIENDKQYSNIDAVLVQVSTFSTLRAAYPNYFLDIGEFIDKVNYYLN